MNTRINPFFASNRSRKTLRWAEIAFALVFAYVVFEAIQPGCFANAWAAVGVWIEQPKLSGLPILSILLVAVALFFGRLGDGSLLLLAAGVVQITYVQVTEFFLILSTLLILTNPFLGSWRGGSARVRFRWMMLALPVSFILASQTLSWRTGVSFHQHQSAVAVLSFVWLALTALTAFVYGRDPNADWTSSVTPATPPTATMPAKSASAQLAPPVASQQPHDEQHGMAQRSNVITYLAEVSHLTFDDVAGMTDLKKRLLDAANEVLRGRGEGNTTKRGDTRNGILLFGEPGVGKTFVVNALAGELRLPIIGHSIGQSISKWTGETTQQMVKLFADARRQAPCVLFLDEIDAVLQSRSSGNQSAEHQITVAAILTDLVNIRSTGVIVVGATNLLASMDTAAIREGRFDFKIEVPMPDFAARHKVLLGAIASGLKKSNSQRAVKAIVNLAEFDLLVKRWEGFPVSRLAMIGEKIGEKFAKDGKAAYKDWLAELRQAQGTLGTAISASTLKLHEMRYEPDVQSRLADLVAHMKQPIQYETRSAVLPRGALFYGPPGTGKTATARAMAASAGWAFLETTGNLLARNPTNITDLIRQAVSLKPCIVFIDEANDIISDRNFNAYASSVNELLAAVDNKDGRTLDVLFVAATNHPNQIDAAIARGGRFEEHIEFTLPSAELMASMMIAGLKRNNVDFSAIDIDSEVAIMGPRSLADVESIVRKVTNAAVARSVRSGNHQTKANVSDFGAATAGLSAA